MTDKENQRLINFSERLYADNESLLLNDQKGKFYQYIEEEIKGYFTAVDPDFIINSLFPNNYNKINRLIPIREVETIFAKNIKDVLIRNVIVNIIEYFQTLIDDMNFMDFRKEIDFQEDTMLESYFRELEKNNAQDLNNKKKYKDLSLKINHQNYEILLNDLEKNKISNDKKPINNINSQVHKNQILSDIIEKNNESNQYKILGGKDSSSVYSHEKRRADKKILEMKDKIKEKLNIKKEFILNQKEIKHKNIYMNYYLLVNHRIFYHKILNNQITKNLIKDIKIPDVPRKSHIDISIILNMIIIFSNLSETKKIKLLYDILKYKINLIENDDVDFVKVSLQNSNEIFLDGVKVKYYHEVPNSIRYGIFKTLKYEVDEFHRLNFQEIAKLYSNQEAKKNFNNDQRKLMLKKNLHFFCYFKKPLIKDNISLIENKETRYSYHTLNLEYYFKQYFDNIKNKKSLKITNNNYLHKFLRNYILICLYLPDFIFTDLIYKKKELDKVFNIRQRISLVKTESHEDDNIHIIGNSKSIISYDTPVFDIQTNQHRNVYDNLTEDCIMYKKILFFASETKGVINEFSNYIFYNSILKNNQNHGVNQNDFMENFKIEINQDKDILNYSQVFNCEFSPNYDRSIKNLNIFSPELIRINLVNYLKYDQKLILFLNQIPSFYNYYENIKRGLPFKRNLIDQNAIIRLNAINDYVHYKTLFSKKKIYIKFFEPKSIEQLNWELEGRITSIENKINNDILMTRKSTKSTIFKGIYNYLLFESKNNVDNQNYLNKNKEEMKSVTNDLDINIDSFRNKELFKVGNQYQDKTKKDLSSKINMSELEALKANLNSGNNLLDIQMEINSKHKKQLDDANILDLNSQINQSIYSEKLNIINKEKALNLNLEIMRNKLDTGADISNSENIEGENVNHDENNKIKNWAKKIMKSYHEDSSSKTKNKNENSFSKKHDEIKTIKPKVHIQLTSSTSNNNDLNNIPKINDNIISKEKVKMKINNNSKNTLNEDNNRIFRFDSDVKFDRKSNLNDRMSELNSEKYILKPLIQRPSTEGDVINGLNIDEEISIIKKENYDLISNYSIEDNSLIIKVGDNGNVNKILDFSNFSSGLQSRDKINNSINPLFALKNSDSRLNEVNNKNNLSSKNIKFVNGEVIKEKYEVFIEEYYRSFENMIKNENHQKLKLDIINLGAEISVKKIKFNPDELAEDKRLNEISKKIFSFESDQLIRFDEKCHMTEKMMNLYFTLLSGFSEFLHMNNKSTRKVTIVELDFFENLQECINNDDFELFYKKYYQIFFTKENKFIFEEESKFFL